MGGSDNRCVVVAGEIGELFECLAGDLSAGCFCLKEERGQWVNNDEETVVAAAEGDVKFFE